MTRKLLTTSIVVLLALIVVPTALAAEGDPVSISGEVIAIDEVGGTFDVQTDTDEVFTVIPPEL